MIATIKIIEDDGKLYLSADIPTEAENMICGVLARHLMGVANEMMDKLLKQKGERIEGATQ